MTTIDLHVDRESVAAGDDVDSHARVVTVSRATLLSAAIEHASPEIKARGWSWVVMVDREVAGVWSVDFGVQLLIADRTIRSGPVDIYFRYFTQIDPAWLFERLAAGAPVNTRDLEAAYAPIAREKYRAELRRRERDIEERLLSSDCIAALGHYGADITLHADIACDFTVAGEEWKVRRADTMLQVFTGGGLPDASIRPTAMGEAWIVGMLAATARVSAGLSAVPDVAVIPGLDLPQVGERWMSSGVVVVQVRTEHAARVARAVHGRSVAEVCALFGA
ncbi:hypothetical protein [Microbacterium sp. GXF0217]